MIQKNSCKHETYFDIRTLVTAELEELWNCYCFEKVVLGWILYKNVQLSQHSGFFLQKNSRRCREKILENFRSQSVLRAKINILEEAIQSVENWHVNWREHFRSVNLGQSLIVLPPWESSLELSGSHPVCGLTPDKVLEPGIIFRQP